MNDPAAGYGVSEKAVMPVKKGIHYGFPLSNDKFEASSAEFIRSD
jgi:hypothetical protein